MADNQLKLTQGRVPWNYSHSYIPATIYLPVSRQKVIWLVTVELGLKGKKLKAARHLLAHLDSCLRMLRYRDKHGFVPIRYEHFYRGKLMQCPRKELLEADLLEQTDYKYREHRSREYRIGNALLCKLAEANWVPGEPSVRISVGEVKQTLKASQPASRRRSQIVGTDIEASCELYQKALKLEQRPIILNLQSVLEFHELQKAKLLEQKLQASNDHVAYRIQCQIDHPQWCLQELTRKGSFDPITKTVTIIPEYVVHLGGRRYCPEIQNLSKNYKRILFRNLYEIDLKSCYTVLLGIIFARAGASITERLKILEDPSYKLNLARRLGFTDSDAVKPIIHALEFGGRLSWKKLSPLKKAQAIRLSCEQIAAAEKGQQLYPGRRVPAILTAVIKAIEKEEGIDLTANNLPTTTVSRIIKTYNKATEALSPLEEENKRAIRALHKWAALQESTHILTNAIGQKLDLRNLPKNRHDQNNALITFLVQGLEAQLIAITEVELSTKGATIIINEHDGLRADHPITDSITNKLTDKLLTAATTNLEKKLIRHVLLITKYSPL
ncbi:MAG: hypothetical protein AB4426_17390 [Xenococcaceae cyanobacterium]